MSKNGEGGRVTVQADMLSACIEYEDILSDKQRGAHPLFLGGSTAVYCGLKILILDPGG